MQKENIIKMLIPVIAVVVVLESVVLVSKLDEGSSNVASSVVSEEITPTEEIAQPVADFIFETDTKEMKLGKSYKVNLNLVGKQDISLDAMEVYVKYDPKKVTLSKLITSKDLPGVTKNSGIDSDSGLVSSIFLWDVGETGLVKTNEVTTVLSFVVTPKVLGETDISLLTGATDEKSVTMIVESSSSKTLAFLGNKLEVNVTE